MSKTKDSNTLQAFWIAIGSLFSFGFAIISSMILSRYLAKGDYGTYKQVLYVYNTFLAIFTLGLPRAFSYFLPRVQKVQAKSIIKKINNLFFLLGSFFSVLLFLFSEIIATVLKNPDLGLALKIFSPVPLLMLPTMGLEGILATFRMTRYMTLYTIATRILMLAFVVLPVVVFESSYIVAIIGFVVASFITFLIALKLKYFPVKDIQSEPCEISNREIFQFTLPVFSATIWILMISSTDQFFISRFFGNVIFAEFSNGSTELPFIGMIVGASATVLSPLISKISHSENNVQKEIYQLWNSVFDKSVKIIYPLLLFSWFFASDIMLFLYGEQYENSYIYFRIFNLLFFFKIIAYAPVIINIGKVKYYAKVNMYIAITFIITEFFFLKIYKSPYVVSSVSVIFQIMRTLLMMKAVASFLGVSLIKLFPIKTILKITPFSIFILYFIELLIRTQFNSVSLVNLIVGFSLFAPIYLLYARIVNLDYWQIVRPLIGKYIKV